MNSKLKSAIKSKDGWWASIFAGPCANRLLEPICEIPWISPNLITVCSLLIGLAAGFCFAKGDYGSLLCGAILVQVSFVVDCMDGQLARYRQQFSLIGAWLDRISDRVKDFWYFFSLAFGFYSMHPKIFYYGLHGLSNFLGLILGTKIFFLPDSLQFILMQESEMPSWIIWPLAMFANFAVFLIDYYVNQDMKLSPREASLDSNSHSKSSFKILRGIFRFGLDVYQGCPILRFNIGEQALLISIFAACGAVYHLFCVFVLLGAFYIIYWPFAKFYGFGPSK